MGSREVAKKSMEKLNQMRRDGLISTSRKGKPNKSTASVKEALEQAFEGIGGVKALINWGNDPKNQTEFYKIWSKLLPLNLQGDLKIGVEIINSYQQNDNTDTV
jgi:hypothetical protein